VSTSLLEPLALPEQQFQIQHRVVKEGIFAKVQKGQFVEVEIDVPEGMNAISVAYDYDEGSVIDIGVIDPRGRQEGFRGWSGSNKKHFFIGENWSTPSYRTGPIPGGKWVVELAGAHIPSDTKYRIEVKAGIMKRFPDPLSYGDGADGHVRSHRPGQKSAGPWLVGDLHLHSLHSDGACSIPDLIAEARMAGLDFIALTEHNTSSHFQILDSLQARNPDVVLLPGREITTYRGHALVIGGPPFLAYARKDINTLFDEVNAFGGLVIVAHPGMPTNEFCRGCGWGWMPDTDFSKVHAMEVQKDVFERMGHTPFKVGQHLFARHFHVEHETLRTQEDIWQEQRLKGFPLTAVGSSDDHKCGKNGKKLEKANIGDIRTVVHAPGGTMKEILQAVKAGHAYVQAAGAKSPVLDFSAVAEGKRYMMGDEVKAQSARFGVTIRRGLGRTVEIIVDGEVHRQQILRRDVQQISFELSGNHEVYVRVIDGDTFVALTNPIRLTGR
jgi:hypothetical protein